MVYVIVPKKFIELIKDKFEEIGIDIPKKNYITLNEFNNSMLGNNIIFIGYSNKINPLKEVAIKNKEMKGINISLVNKEVEIEYAEIHYTIYLKEIEKLKNILNKMNINSEIKLENSKFIKPEANKSYYLNDKTKYGKIILAYTPKGGVGKTQVTQIVSELAGHFIDEGKKILFVDSNYSESSFSDRFLEYSSSNSLDVVLKEFENDNNIEIAIKNAIVREPTFNYQHSKEYKLKNVDVLFAPQNDGLGVERAYSNPIFYKNLFTSLRRMYDIIFVDTSNEATTPTNHYLLKEADVINFIITSDTYSVRQTINFLKRENFSFEKFNIFANNFKERLFGEGLEVVIAKMIGKDPDSKEVREYIKNRVFHIPGIETFVQVNNLQDGIFNPYNKYISKKEKEEIIFNILKMLRQVSPEMLKSEYRLENDGFLTGILKLFKKRKEL